MARLQRPNKPASRPLGAALSVVEAAADALARGGVVVIPTDTVYGLAAVPWNVDAVRRIFQLKGRPSDKSLQLLVPDETWLDRYGVPSAAARALAHRYWPGPLTIIIPSSDGTVGLRVPANELALDVLRRSGPLAATSANRSGEDTPNDLQSIREIFGESVDVYVDGGRIAGIASTVVDTTGTRVEVVREGAISALEIMRAVESRFEAE
jgi:tRNA threonylcarbamoyl adenosine modification protein (Sua5/YciO/YrdC/YwlC family)